MSAHRSPLPKGEISRYGNPSIEVSVEGEVRNLPIPESEICADDYLSALLGLAVDMGGSRFEGDAIETKHLVFDGFEQSLNYLMVGVEKPSVELQKAITFTSFNFYYKKLGLFSEDNLAWILSAETYPDGAPEGLEAYRKKISRGGMIDYRLIEQNDYDLVLKKFIDALIPEDAEYDDVPEKLKNIIEEGMTDDQMRKVIHPAIAEVSGKMKNAGIAPDDAFALDCIKVKAAMLFHYLMMLKRGDVLPEQLDWMLRLMIKYIQSKTKVSEISEMTPEEKTKSFFQFSMEGNSIINYTPAESAFMMENTDEFVGDDDIIELPEKLFTDPALARLCQGVSVMSGGASNYYPGIVQTWWAVISPEQKAKYGLGTGHAPDYSHLPNYVAPMVSTSARPVSPRSTVRTSPRTILPPLGSRPPSPRSTVRTSPKPASPRTILPPLGSRPLSPRSTLPPLGSRPLSPRSTLPPLGSAAAPFKVSPRAASHRALGEHHPDATPFKVSPRPSARAERPSFPRDVDDSKCQEITKKGERCKRNHAKGSKYCAQHSK